MSAFVCSRTKADTSKPGSIWKLPLMLPPSRSMSAASLRTMPRDRAKPAPSSGNSPSELDWWWMMVPRESRSACPR